MAGEATGPLRVDQDLAQYLRDFGSVGDIAQNLATLIQPTLTVADMSRVLQPSTVRTVGVGVELVAVAGSWSLVEYAAGPGGGWLILAMNTVNFAVSRNATTQVVGAPIILPVQPYDPRYTPVGSLRVGFRPNASGRFAAGARILIEGAPNVSYFATGQLASWVPPGSTITMTPVAQNTATRASFQVIEVPRAPGS